MHKDGFVGAVINGHNRGRYLDDKLFWPILERAEALALPIYLHPTQPPKRRDRGFVRRFRADGHRHAGRAAWGWHIETAVHLLRMILGGVFDRFPEAASRDRPSGRGAAVHDAAGRRHAAAVTKLERPVSAYLRGIVHYTFAGFNFPPAFLDLLLEVGVDRIMFSADYPYASMAEGRAFLEQIPVTAADKERIAHGNAEKLFKL